MALPAEISTVIMTGTVLDEQGDPYRGSVILTPSVSTLISASTNRFIRVRERVLQLNADGYFAIPLIPSAESDVVPNGLFYTLTLSNDQRADPVVLKFTVPSGVSTADVSGSVIEISAPAEPQYLLGYRGPTGPTGSPGITQAQLQAAIGNGPAAAATPNTIVLRDANGRAKVAAPSATDDIANLQSVTTAVNNEATARANADLLLIPLAQKNQPSGVAVLDSNSRSLANGAILNHVAAPAATGTDQTYSEMWSQSDLGLYFRSKGTGASRRMGTYWGSGTSYPSGALPGDTFARTDTGFVTGCMFELTSAGWRQVEIATVSSLANMNALNMGYRGFQVYRSDLGYAMEYQNATSGWTRPWSQPWGTIYISTDPSQGGARGQSNNVGPNGNPYFNFFAASGQGQNYYLNRTYEFTYSVFAYTANTAGRYALVTFPQVVNDAGTTDYLGAKAHQVLHGNLGRFDYIDINSSAHWNPTQNYTNVYARLINYTTYNPGSAIYWDTNIRQFFAVKDMGPVGAPA